MPSEPKGEAVFNGLLSQVHSIREALGIEVTGVMAVLSEANFVMGLASSGTLPQQAAALLKALGRAPSPPPPMNRDSEIIAERVSRARRSKHFIGTDLQVLEKYHSARASALGFAKAGTSGQGQPPDPTLHVPKPQRYGKGTNSVGVVAGEDQLVSLKFLVGPDAQVVVRIASWDSWGSPAPASPSSARTKTALEALHREQADMATLLEQVQQERDMMRQELLRQKARAGWEPDSRGTDWWAQSSPTAPRLPVELAAKLRQPGSGSQSHWRDEAATRATSLRSSRPRACDPPARSRSLVAPRKSRSEVPEAFTVPQKWPTSGAQRPHQSGTHSWSSPRLGISTLRCEGPLYMVSAHRWGPVEVLRKMNAWVDDSTFRCMGSTARVKGLEVPLDRVRAVLPFERHKRFSVCLHDGSVHTFRVVGTRASDATEKMRAWVGAIGRSSALLQKQLAEGQGSPNSQGDRRGSPNSQLLGDGTAVSLGLFPRAGATSPSPITPPGSTQLLATAGRTLSPSPADQPVREITQLPQAAAARPKPRRSKPPPAGLPPAFCGGSSGALADADSDSDADCELDADVYKRRAGPAKAASGAWRELCTYSVLPTTASALDEDSVLPSTAPARKADGVAGAREAIDGALRPMLRRLSSLGRKSLEHDPPKLASGRFLPSFGGSSMASSSSTIGEASQMRV